MAVKPLKQRTLSKYRNAIVPNRINNRKPQGERRREALCSAVNHASLAAMWPIALEKIADSALGNIGIFNFDSTSLLLEDVDDENGSIFLAAGSQQELRARQLHPAGTNKRENVYKRRGLGLTTTISAGGFLSSVVISIKDGAFSEIKHYEVNSFSE